jgi:hypothetical protein
MSLTVTELTDGQTATFSGKAGARIRVFSVSGADNPEDAAVATGIPALGTAYSLNFWYLTVKSVDAKQFGRDDLYQVTVTYGYQQDSNGRPDNPSAGDEIWALDISGQNTNRKSAFAQDKYGDKARDVGLLVGANTDGSIDGVDVPVPHAVLTVSQWLAPASVDAGFIKGCLAIVGKCNNADFYSFAAGEVLFNGVRIVNKGSSLYELEFSFQVQMNEVAADLPAVIDWYTGQAITLRDKKGWEYIWLDQAPHDNAGTLETRVRGVYIAQVVKAISFDDLGLTGTL